MTLRRRPAETPPGATATGTAQPDAGPDPTPSAGRPASAGRFTVYLAGASTAANKRATAAPESGWGMALPLFLSTEIAVRNHAVNGVSTKSFYHQGRLEPIRSAIVPGDLLLIQFGHNDQKVGDPVRSTDPYTTYQDYLRCYLEAARSRGALPVLLTPVERRRFDADGSAEPSHGEYPAAMRDLAAEEQVPLLDLQARTMAEWDAQGPELTQGFFLWLAPGEHPNYPDGIEDNTHFQPHGAIEVARMVTWALLEQGVVDASDVRRLDEEIPDSALSWP